MDKKDYIDIDIVTPNEQAIKDQTDFVMARLDEGEIGFQKNHTPLIGKISTGYIRFNEKFVAIVNGIVDFNNNTFTVICQNAQIGDSYEDALKKMEDKKQKALKESRRKLVDFTEAERDLVNCIKQARLGNIRK